MRTVSALTLRKQMGAILDAAAAGELILVTRLNIPLVMLMSVSQYEELEAKKALGSAPDDKI